MAVLLRLHIVALSIDLACTGADTLFLRYHALLELIQDGEELACGLLDVGHGGLQLISRVEAA